MNTKVRIGTLTLVLVAIAGGASTALADETGGDTLGVDANGKVVLAWGTVADAESCAKELTDGPEKIGGWVHYECVKEPCKTPAPAEPKNASPGCKAEVHKRGELCKKDAVIQNNAKARNTSETAFHFSCLEEAYSRIKRQRDKAAADKKFADERKAAAEKAELPKAAKRDPALEKSISATYMKEFPKAKILKVILIADWSTERNNYGTVIARNIQAAVVNRQGDVCEIYNELWQQEFIKGKFSGPMLERGAGSLERTEIVCSKVK
jgi:hypothetical protein